MHSKGLRPLVCVAAATGELAKQAGALKLCCVDESALLCCPAQLREAVREAEGPGICHRQGQVAAPQLDIL